jgi:hypothetical protein
VAKTQDYYLPEFEILGVFDTQKKATEFFEKTSEKNNWKYPYHECMEGDNPDFFTKTIQVQ